jgi:lactate dehydrogenase-like 2-hydroxyacid dehydrogenase
MQLQKSGILPGSAHINVSAFLLFSVAQIIPSYNSMGSEKPIVLHLGDPVEFNKELFAQISEQFTVIRPSLDERQRDTFARALKEKKWGDFQGIFRPFWNTGGEMGRWDAELIPLLPSSVKIFASAGAGYDWMDVDILAEHGINVSFTYL